MDIRLPLPDKTHMTASLCQNDNGEYGIVLRDAKGRPVARKGYTFSGRREAERFQELLLATPKNLRASLIYARLGYGETRGLKRNMGSTMCHPGHMPMQGAPGKRAKEPRRGAMIVNSALRHA